jgi:hypothetical protein
MHILRRKFHLRISGLFVAEYAENENLYTRKGKLDNGKTRFLSHARNFLVHHSNLL